MSDTTIEVVNPATGRLISAVEGWDAKRVEAAVARAHTAARAWALVPVAERAARAARLARTLREHRGALASLAVAEMGKPVSEAEGEVEKSALTAEYYARQGPIILAHQHIEVDTFDAAEAAWVSHEPLGLVLAVMPWNFPV
ncbi:MAG: aldehyde dehydrogenase family protein, partial [Streptomyces sp.]|nr:aldehyde dehydrogenase family protein [Streptomyces sp.]